MSIRARTITFALGILAAVALAGCGQSGPPEKGLLVSGPGVHTTQPPWTPQYGGLAQRINGLGLPTGSSEKFHIHALLSIYNHGLYAPVPANVGIDQHDHIETTIHTHDNTGIIHMEAPRPFRYTIGDLFAIWGVRFGAGTLGALQDDGGNRVWVYANGKAHHRPRPTRAHQSTARTSPSAAPRAPSRTRPTPTCSSRSSPARTSESKRAESNGLHLSLSALSSS